MELWNTAEGFEAAAKYDESQGLFQIQLIAVIFTQLDY